MFDETRAMGLIAELYVAQKVVEAEAARLRGELDEAHNDLARAEGERDKALGLDCQGLLDGSARNDRRMPVHPPALGESVVAESRGWILMICCRTAGQIGAVDLPAETVVYSCAVGRGERWCATMHTRSWRAAEIWCCDTAYTLEMARREVDDE